MYQFCRKYNINLTGRDFVIGDIHGAFDLVETALLQVNFNPITDRLFSVGDLIDRGNKSCQIMNFLLKPYVYPVKGNHEHDFALLSIKNIRSMSKLPNTDLQWTEFLNNSDLYAIQEKFNSLPISIEVMTDAGNVGIVHGEVPIGMNWNEFTNSLECLDVETQQSALYGRKRFKNKCHHGVKEIKKIFSGHTIQLHGIRQLGNVYGIDTGAIFREISGKVGSLTMADISCDDSVLIPKKIDTRIVATYEKNESN